MHQSKTGRGEREWRQGRTRPQKQKTFTAALPYTAIPLRKTRQGGRRRKKDHTGDHRNPPPNPKAPIIKPQICPIFRYARSGPSPHVED